MKAGERGKQRLSEERLRQMIEAATVDCDNESEQITGFFTMIDDNLEVPFETLLLGVPTVVERVDMANDDTIVAVCSRGGHRQRISILDLPLPDSPPKGAEWIEAYRRWSK
jgi:hypothetical protein